MDFILLMRSKAEIGRENVYGTSELIIQRIGFAALNTTIPVPTSDQKTRDTCID